MWHYNCTDTLYHGNYSPAYMATDYDNSLAHYGVLGMKWGVRKERESSGSRVGGRRQLSAKTKKRLKKLAIGAGITAGVAGTAALTAIAAKQLKTVGGIKGIKAARAGYRGLNPGAKNIGLNKLGLDAALRNQAKYANYKNAPGAALRTLNNQRAAQRALDPVKGLKAKRIADQTKLANQMAAGREAATLRRGNQAIKARNAARNQAVTAAQRESRQSINEGLRLQKKAKRKLTYRQANRTSSGVSLRLNKKHYRA